MVLLLGPWAVKFPRPTSWEAFLFGLLNNMTESRTKGPGLCPVLWSCPGGFAIVMPRVAPLVEGHPYDLHAFREAHNIAAEAKASSFGILHGQLVCIDYGWRYRYG